VALADPARVADARRLLEAHLGGKVQHRAEGTQLSVMAGTTEAASQAIAALIADKIELEDFSMGSPSLEEVFFALTGGSSRLARPEGDEK